MHQKINLHLIDQAGTNQLGLFFEAKKRSGTGCRNHFCFKKQNPGTWPVNFMMQKTVY